MSSEENKIGLSPREVMYKKFWQTFNQLSTENSIFSELVGIHPYAATRTYQDYCFNHSYHIVLKINFKRHEVAVGAYFSNLAEYDSCFENHRMQIEESLKHKMEWSRHKTKASAYLFGYLDFDDSHGWEDACKWIIENAILVKRIFNKYV